MDASEVIEIEFPESPIPDRTYRRLDEVTVRKDGCVWRVHRSDPDPFPSRPHAHYVESGLKMHLGNGALFFGNRDTGNRISSKNLAFIRQQLSQMSIELPPLIRG